MGAFFKDRGFGIGYAVMVVGVALMIIGLGVDAWLHARDPHLAEEESLFSLENPGHALIFAGLATIVVGAFVGPYSRWVLGRGSWLAAVGTPAFALAFAAAVSAAFVLVVHSESHDHGPAAEAHASDSGEHHIDDPSHASEGHVGHHLDRVLPENLEFLELEEGTFHEPPNPYPVTEENIRFAEQFLIDARERTDRYRDANVALAEGYFQITQHLPLIGAHFFNPSNVGSLDPGRPAILLYEPDGEGGWDPLGVSYMLFKAESNDTPPETPFGGLVDWHYHTNLCFGLGTVDIAESADECPGQFVAETPWLLHVWIWKDSPEGVFDHMNSLVQ
jgi:hypothetical protein